MRFLGIGACLFWGGQVAAQDTSLGDVGLRLKIEALQADPRDNAFETGLLLGLRAVERTMQARYAYGIGDGMNGLPLLRAATGAANPSPLPRTPGTFTTIFRQAIADLDSARAMLDRAAATRITPFELSLRDVWFDINGNGVREANENMIDRLLPILIGPQAVQGLDEGALADDPLIVRFDTSDHAWATAYTHMLSGFANLVVAFDPTPVFARLDAGRAALAEVPQIADTADTDQIAAEIAALEEAAAELAAELEPIATRYQALRAEIAALYRAEAADRDQTVIDRLSAEANALQTATLGPKRAQQALIRDEIAAARAKLGTQTPDMFSAFREEIDGVYVVLAALRQAPDPAHLAATRDHWLAMIAHNRTFWSRLEAEDDNTREWIPNPRQTSVLPVEVTPELAQAWQRVLQDAEDVLEGRLLMAHPLLPEGIGLSLPAYVADPAPFEIVDWFHGIGAYPYAARGPLISQQRWIAFRRLAGGNAGGLALLFN